MLESQLLSTDCNNYRQVYASLKILCKEHHNIWQKANDRIVKNVWDVHLSRYKPAVLGLVSFDFGNLAVMTICIDLKSFYCFLGIFFYKIPPFISCVQSKCLWQIVYDEECVTSVSFSYKTRVRASNLFISALRASSKIADISVWFCKIKDWNMEECGTKSLRQSQQFCLEGKFCEGLNFGPEDKLS